MRRTKHLFELSAEEQTEHLRRRVAEVQQDNLSAGLYNVFLDPDSKEHRIRKYSDHTELITVNETTGRSRVVKRISR